MSFHIDCSGSFPTRGHVLFVADPDPNNNSERVKELLAQFPQAHYPAHCEDRTLLTLHGDDITFLVWIERRKRLNSQLGRALKQLLTTCIQHLSVIYHFGPSQADHEQWDKLYGLPLQAFVDRYHKFTVTLCQPRCFFLVGDPYLHRQTTSVHKVISTLPKGSHVIWLSGLPIKNDENVAKFIAASKLWHHTHDAPGGVIAKGYAEIMSGYHIDEVFIFSAPKDMTNLVTKMAKRSQTGHIIVTTVE